MKPQSSKAVKRAQGPRLESVTAMVGLERRPVRAGLAFALRVPMLLRLGCQGCLRNIDLICIRDPFVRRCGRMGIVRCPLSRFKPQAE